MLFFFLFFTAPWANCPDAQASSLAHECVNLQTNLYLSIKHNRCAARHAHVPILVYADVQVAAEQVNRYFIVRQSLSIGGYRAGASPRTACHSLAAAAFPNPHTQFLPILHAHKLHIRPMREVRVFLNTRTRLPYHFVRNLPLYHHHSMRIAHIYDG